VVVAGMGASHEVGVLQTPGPSSWVGNSPQIKMDNTTDVLPTSRQ
jgi:hypothetical protein